MTQVDVLARGLSFPEGPAFAPDGTLWFVDLQRRSLGRFGGETLTTFPADGVPNGSTFDRRGRLVFCDAERGALRRFSPATGGWEVLAERLDGRPLRAPNDLAFDALGNLVFTCPGGSEREPVGYVGCLSPEGDLSRVAEGLRFPNGLAFTDGGRTLVVAETHRQRLLKGAWDAPARRWRPEPWADIGGAVEPDGMAFGADGRLYVAVFGSGQVRVVDEAGRTAEHFDLPGQNPTNVAFDPSGRLGLVVTETERGELLSLPELGPGAALFDGGARW